MGPLLTEKEINFILKVTNYKSIPESKSHKSLINIF